MQFQLLTYILLLIFSSFGLISCSKEEVKKIKQVQSINPQIQFNNGETIKLKNSLKENIVLSSTDVVEINTTEDFSINVHSVCALDTNGVTEQNFAFDNVTQIKVINILPYQAIYKKLAQNKAINCDFEFKYFSETLIQRFFIRTAPITLHSESHRNYIFDKRTKVKNPNSISYEDFSEIEVISSTNDNSQWHLICGHLNYQVNEAATYLNVEQVFREALFIDKTPFYINSDNCIFIERDSKQDVRFTQPLNFIPQKATPVFNVKYARKSTSSLIIVNLSIYNPFSFPIYIDSHFKNKAKFIVKSNGNAIKYEVVIRKNKVPHLNWKLEPNQTRNLQFDMVPPFSNGIGASNILCIEDILNEFKSKNIKNPVQKVSTSIPSYCYNLNYKRFESGH